MVPKFEFHNLELNPTFKSKCINSETFLNIGNRLDEFYHRNHYFCSFSIRKPTSQTQIDVTIWKTSTADFYSWVYFLLTKNRWLVATDLSRSCHYQKNRGSLKFLWDPCQCPLNVLRSQNIVIGTRHLYATDLFL